MDDDVKDKLTPRLLAFTPKPLQRTARHRSAEYDVEDVLLELLRVALDVARVCRTDGETWCDMFRKIQEHSPVPLRMTDDAGEDTTASGGFYDQRYAFFRELLAAVTDTRDLFIEGPKDIDVRLTAAFDRLDRLLGRSPDHSDAG